MRAALVVTGLVAAMGALRRGRGSMAIPKVGPTPGMNMEGLSLEGADLSDLNLEGANLSHANLFGSSMSNSILRGANLSGADLSGSDLRGADLRGADLSEAVLVFASYNEETVMPPGVDPKAHGMIYEP